MNVVIVEPAKRPYVKDIDSSDETLKKIVSGEIEITAPFKDMSISLIGNAFAKAIGLRPSRRIVDEMGEVMDVLCGTFIICGSSPDGKDFASLTEEQQDFYIYMFDDITVRTWR